MNKIEEGLRMVMDGMAHGAFTKIDLDIIVITAQAVLKSTLKTIAREEQRKVVVECESGKVTMSSKNPQL